MTIAVIDAAASIMTVMKTIPGVRILDVRDGRREFIGTARRGSEYRSNFPIFNTFHLLVVLLSPFFNDRAVFSTSISISNIASQSLQVRVSPPGQLCILPRFIRPKE